MKIDITEAFAAFSNEKPYKKGKITAQEPYLLFHNYSFLYHSPINPENYQDYFQVRVPQLDGDGRDEVSGYLNQIFKIKGWPMKLKIIDRGKNEDGEEVIPVCFEILGVTANGSRVPSNWNLRLGSWCNLLQYLEAAGLKQKRRLPRKPLFEVVMPLS